APTTRSRRLSSMTSPGSRSAQVRWERAWLAGALAAASSRSRGEAEDTTWRLRLSRVIAMAGALLPSCRNGHRTALGRARANATDGMEQLESVRPKDRRDVGAGDGRGGGDIRDAGCGVPLHRDRRWLDGARARSERRLRRRSRQVPERNEEVGGSDSR